LKYIEKADGANTPRINWSFTEKFDTKLKYDNRSVLSADQKPNINMPFLLSQRAFRLRQLVQQLRHAGDEGCFCIIMS